MDQLVPSSTTIAALESIEAAAWVAIYRAQPASSPHRLDTPVAPGGVALLALLDLPWTEFNKALGFRPDSPPRGSEIDALRRWLDANGAPSWALQLPEPMLDAGLRDALHAAGLESKGRGMAKLRRGLGDPGDGGATTFAIREIGADRAGDFARTVQAGFGGSPVLLDTFLPLPGRPDWRTYVAYEGDRPVACGALFVQGSLGWVGIGATHPDWRGRGAQSALIRRRIRDGLAAGVALFAAETGVPVPGQEQKSVSFNNLVRAGFAPAYTRPNFGPADPQP